jgi:uncharacterized protein (DUF305 family)
VLAIVVLATSASLFLTRPAPSADSVDIGFSQDMTVHHRQAVVMAALARDRATDPDLRWIGYDIETTQLAQVGQMQGWLDMWDAASLSTGPHMTWMTSIAHHAGGDQGMTGRATMPGMATEQELQRLGQAAGVEFEVLFLQLMLRHHQGGAPMLTYAETHAETPQVRNFAKQMLIAQTGESAVFADLLADRRAQPLPPPA